MEWLCARVCVCACVPYFHAVRFMDLFAQCIVLVRTCAWCQRSSRHGAALFSSPVLGWSSDCSLRCLHKSKFPATICWHGGLNNLFPHGWTQNRGNSKTPWRQSYQTKNRLIEWMKSMRPYSARRMLLRWYVLYPVYIRTLPSVYTLLLPLLSFCITPTRGKADFVRSNSE